MNCPNCNTPISKSDAVFCGSCGAPLQSNKQHGSKKILLFLMIPFIIIAAFFAIAYKAMNEKESPFVASEEIVYPHDSAPAGVESTDNEINNNENNSENNSENIDDGLTDGDLQPPPVERAESQVSEQPVSEEIPQPIESEVYVDEEPTERDVIVNEEPAEYIPPEWEYEEIYWLLYGYASAVADAVNYNDFYYISGYMLYDSPIYNEQSDYISKVNAYEEFNHYELLSLDYVNPNRCVAMVEEGYYIDNFKSEPANKRFKTTYTLVKVEGVWMLHSIDELVKL